MTRAIMSAPDVALNDGRYGELLSRRDLGAPRGGSMASA